MQVAEIPATLDGLAEFNLQNALAAIAIAYAHGLGQAPRQAAATPQAADRDDRQPGDRRDDDMREMGALAAELFDEIVFREEPERLGRKPGEIVALLVKGARAAGFPPERIHKILDEREAADACLKLARPGSARPDGSSARRSSGCCSS